MRFRNGFFLAGVIASFVGCQSRPMVVVDVNRTGDGSDRIEVEFDRTQLRPDDVVYVAQENLGPGHERLTVAPEAKSMVHGDIRVRVIVESVPGTATTRPVR